MCNSQQQKWNLRYSEDTQPTGVAADVLVQNLHLLPESGSALDLACGLGANACLLASRGFRTTAWDISSVAIDKLSETAKLQSLKLIAEVRDLEIAPPEENSFDIIVVSRYLDRKMIPNLTLALKPEGVLFYQTFTKEKLDSTGPNRQEYLLGCNELLVFFSDLRVLSFKDEGAQGDMQHGSRNESWIVARKEAKI